MARITSWCSSPEDLINRDTRERFAHPYLLIAAALGVRVGGTVVRLVPACTRTRAVSTIFHSHSLGEQSSAAKMRSGAGCKEFKRAARWIPDALNPSPGEVFRNLMSQINDQGGLGSYFGMSLFPRLAPTDVEMSLTAHVNLPARVCGEALGRPLIV